MMNRPLLQGGEQHKVVDMTPYVYKPCFNLPVKPVVLITPVAKKEGPPRMSGARGSMPPLSTNYTEKSFM